MLRFRSSYKDATGVQRLTGMGIKRRRNDRLVARRMDPMENPHHIVSSPSFRPNIRWNPASVASPCNQLRFLPMVSVIGSERLFSTSITPESDQDSVPSIRPAASPQSLDKMDWREVVRVLKTLLGELKDRAPLEKVKLAFALIDHLNQEASSYYDVVDQPKDMIRLDGPLLTMALVAWRKYTMDELKRSMKLYADQRQVSERRKVLQKLDSENMSPQQVLDRIKDYLHTKLFPVNPRFFNIIISVVGKVEERQNAPIVADTIFEEMIQQNQKTYPCDSVTITELVRIWTVSKLPESATRAEVYLKALRDWQAETQRANMDPHPELFCLVMEAHAYTNPAHLALPRILELYSEMKEATSIPRSPKQSALSMSRIASAMATCQGHPQSTTAAEAVIQEFCQAFLENHGWRQIDELFGAMEGARLPEEERIWLMFHLLNCLSDLSTGELEANDERGYLSERKLGALLARWRDHLKNNNDNHEDRLSGAGFYADEPLAHSSGLDPSRVFEYVKGCTDSKLSTGNAICQNIILNAIAMLNDYEEPLRLGHSIFEYMVEQSSSDLSHNQHPNRATINELLKICASSKSAEAQERAEFYFDHLKMWHQETKRDDMKPEVKTYCALADVYGYCSKPDPQGAILKIKDIFLEMKEKCEKFHIIAFTYQRVCRAVSRCHDPAAADVIRSLIDELCELYLQKRDTVLGKDLRPPQGLYASLLFSYARSGRFHDANDFIDQMDSMATASQDPTLRVSEQVKKNYVANKKQFAKIPKEKILQTSVGASQESIWNQADDYLASLRVGKLSDIPERVEYMFEIMDRLYREAIHREKSTSLPLRPLDRLVFSDMLKLWHEKAVVQLSQAVKGPNDSDEWELGTLSMFQKIVRYTESGLIEPNPNYFNTLLRTIRMTEDRQRAPYVAHDIYQELLTKASHSPIDRTWHPTKTTVQEMIDLWSQSRLPEAPERAEGYLSDLQRWNRQVDSNEMNGYHSPDSRHYCSVIEAYSRSSTPEFAFRNIQHLYSEMKHHTPADMDTIAYTRVCHAIADCGTSGSADFARGILDSMCKDYFENGIEKSKPSQSTFNAVLKAYGKAGRAHDANELILYMKELAKKTGDKYWEPNEINSSALIRAHAKAGDVEAANAQIVELQNGKDLHTLEPAALNGLLSAWAESGDEEAPGRITDVIQNLENSDRNASVESTTSIYNNLLRAYSRQGTVASAEAAQQLLQSMEAESTPSPNPDQESFTSCLRAWSEARAPDRADSLLKHMCEQVRLGRMNSSVLTQQHFSIVISAWGDSENARAVERATSVFDLMKEMNMRPNTTAYNSYLWAKAKSPNTNDVEAVEDLFLQMQTEWKRGGDFLKPNEASYHALFHSLRSLPDPGAISRVQDYIQEMEKLEIKRKPSLYATIIDLLARNGHVDQAEELFRDTRQRINDGVGDWSVVHRHRFWAFFNQKDPKMLERVLREWIADFESGLITEPPSSKEFGSTVHRWFRSDHPGMLQAVENLVDKMFEMAENGSSTCIPNSRLGSSIISAFMRQRSSKAGTAALRLMTNQQKFAMKNPEMTDIQPNLLLYSGTILALINAPATNGSESAVATLLDQLAEKGDDFWDTKFQPIEILTRIKGALKASSLASKYDLIAKCDGLAPLATMEEWL